MDKKEKRIDELLSRFKIGERETIEISVSEMDVIQSAVEKGFVECLCYNTDDTTVITLTPDGIKHIANGGYAAIMRQRRMSALRWLLALVRG